MVVTVADLILAGLLLVSVPFAIRATWRLWHIWRADESRSLLLFAFWIVAFIVTVAGVWVGFLSVRRLLGAEPLSWTAPITAIVTVATLQVPAILDTLVQRVARRPDEPDNIGQGPQ